MKKIFTLFVALFAMGVSVAFAQSWVFEDFESYSAGKYFPCINNPMGMPSDAYYVCVMEDPLGTYGNSLCIRYDPSSEQDCIKIPAFKVKLAEGETVADITSFSFDFYCYQYPSGDVCDDVPKEYFANNPDVGTDVFNNSSGYAFVYYFIPTDNWYQEADLYMVDSGKNAAGYHNYSLKNVWIEDCSWDIAAPDSSQDLNEFYFCFGQNGRQVYWVADNLTFYGVTGSDATYIGDIEVDAAGNTTGFYNLAGQKLSEAPAQGLYIKDGKKVLAK